MAYAVQIARPALGQLRGLPRDIQERLRPHIRDLAQNPHPPGSRKLVGQNDYRVRVGDYRLVYEIDAAAAIVTVTVVLHRKDAYRNR